MMDNPKLLPKPEIRISLKLRRTAFPVVGHDWNRLGSVATQLRFGGISSDNVITNFLLILRVKEF